MGLQDAVAGDEAEAPLPRWGDGDDREEAGEDARSSDLVSAFIADFCDDGLEAKS